MILVASLFLHVLRRHKFDLRPQDKSDHSDGLNALENRTKNFGSELSREVQNLDETVGETRSHDDLKENNGLSSNGVDISTEEYSVSKVDNTDLGISSNSMNSGSTKDKGLDDLKPLENGIIKKVDNFLSFKALDMPDMDQHNSFRSDKRIELDNQNQKGNMNGCIINEVEENIQKTPPHSDIFSEPEMNMVENKKNSKSRIIVENSFACESIHKGINLKKSLTFKRKVALNPCSQGKFMRTRGSLSYRRLLPYLMEVSNNNPYNLFDASKCQQTPTDKSKANYSITDHPGVDLMLNPSNAVPISNADLSDNKKKLVSGEKGIEIQKVLDSPKKCTSPVEKSFLKL